MVKEAFGIGDTINDALKAACKELGIDSEEAQYEVIQEPEKKKFGLFGGNPAKVRAYIEITPAQKACEYLKSVLSCMGLNDIEFEVTEEDNTAEINLKGEDVGFIIGRRGETLDALQYLAGLVANHVDNQYYRVTINTGNYREKREVTLENLGKKLAIKAVKTGKSINLEPMNPYERRIIHTAVQQVNGAISFSEGEVLDRHVVIAPDPKNPVKPRRSGGYHGGKSQRQGKGGGRSGSYNGGRGSSSGEYKRSSYKQPIERKPYQNKYNKPSDDEMITTSSTFSQRSPIEKAGLPLFSKIETKGDE
ncbi:MAG: protein jag [Clostridia bacterium]|nr:protein jag [Clostridia bacterium]